MLSDEEVVSFFTMPLCSSQILIISLFCCFIITSYIQYSAAVGTAKTFWTLHETHSLKHNGSAGDSAKTLDSIA